MATQIFGRPCKHADASLNDEILKSFVIEGSWVIKLFLQIVVDLLRQILNFADSNELIESMIF